MGIEKTGRGAPPEIGAADPAAGSVATGQVERTFGEAHAAARAAKAELPPSPIEALRAGRVDVEGYVRLRVEGAVAGLRGLSDQQLDTIRAVLREQLLTDPVLADLVRQATGRSLSPPDE